MADDGQGEPVAVQLLVGQHSVTLLQSLATTLEGEVAARRTLSRVCQHLEGELGAVPPNLLRLQARLGGLN